MEEAEAVQEAVAVEVDEVQEVEAVDAPLSAPPPTRPGRSSWRPKAAGRSTRRRRGSGRRSRHS